MIDPDRAERDDEGPLEDIEIDDDAPAIILKYARTHGYRPAHPRVLPPGRFQRRPGRAVAVRDDQRPYSSGRNRSQKRQRPDRGSGQDSWATSAIVTITIQ